MVYLIFLSKTTPKGIEVDLSPNIPAQSVHLLYKGTTESNFFFRICAWGQQSGAVSSTARKINVKVPTYSIASWLKTARPPMYVYTCICMLYVCIYVCKCMQKSVLFIGTRFSNLYNAVHSYASPITAI